MVDGASVWRQYWASSCRSASRRWPLATLEFTWIYNDFFWALVLMNTVTSGRSPRAGRVARAVLHQQQPDRRGSLVAALPTLIVYFVLQRQFIGGLTLGSTKG